VLGLRSFTCSLSGSVLGEIVTPAAGYSSAMCATCESNALLLSMPWAMHSSNDPRILACTWVGLAYALAYSLAIDMDVSSLNINYAMRRCDCILCAIFVLHF